MLRKIVTCVVVIAFASVSCIADGKGATLYSKGNVTVNGGKSMSHSTVLPGDVVATARDSYVLIARDGLTIKVADNSRLTYNDRMVGVECGHVAIATQNRLPVKVQDIMVLPATAKASYDVVNTPDSLKISARSGNLKLRQGAQSVALSAGHTAILPGGCGTLAANAMPAPSAAPLASEPMASQGPGSGGSMSGAGISHLTIIAGLVPVIAVAVLAGVLGATAGYKSTSRP